MNLIVRRKLNNYDAWKRGVSVPDGLRKKYGSKGATVYRSAHDPNEVYLVFEWQDGMPPSEYLNLPEVKKALADSGTTEVIEVQETFQLSE